MAHLLPKQRPGVSSWKRACYEAGNGSASVLFSPKSDPICPQAFQPRDGDARDVGHAVPRACFTSPGRARPTVPSQLAETVKAYALLWRAITGRLVRRADGA